MPKKKPTKAEKEHYASVQSLNCVACRVIGILDSPAVIHHPTTGVGMGQKSDYLDVIPLCPAHHNSPMKYGVAIHAGKIAFEAVYGTEAELLRMVRDLLQEAV